MKMRFSPLATPYLMAFFISLFMSLLMSGVVTLINLGAQEFFAHWAHAWIRVWPIAFAAALIASPLARRIVNYLVTPSSLT